VVNDLRIAVDIGGTFTDVVLEEGGRRLTRKLLTTPQRPEQAVLDGVRLILGDAGKGFADVAVFVHGTTLATNAVIERRGARTAPSSSASLTLPCTSTRSGTTKRSARGTSGLGFSMVRSYWS